MLHDEADVLHDLGVVMHMPKSESKGSYGGANGTGRR